MISKVAVLTIFGMFYTLAVWCQDPPSDRQNVPIYRVTVVERTVKAVDYQYRNGPTFIDFRGTVLMPKAKGNATVESKAGRTEVDVKFDRVDAPGRFGPEYLTYVLWAITPEGHAKNLGEVLANSSDHARLHVTTDLQAFAMIVTAEPYSAVRQPSDVVVMENEIRPDTTGHIEQIQAKYELLPRGHYTYDVSAGVPPPGATAAGVPFDRYEEIVEVYQAQNAVQIARAMGADRYAADTFSKAESLLSQAKEYQLRRADKSTIVTAARQAAQTAEDARAITIKRKQDEELASAQDQASREQQLRLKAEAEAQRAQAQASADRSQLEAERSARVQAENEAAAARAVPPQPPVQTTAVVPAVPPPDNHKTERTRLLQDLNSSMQAMDSPRGIVVTVPDADFRGSLLNPSVSASMARIAAAISARPGLYIVVEGNTDNSGGEARDEQFSYQRAAAVRDALVQNGVPANSISARGLGSSRPMVSNASASGRAQNRRVEITISGDPIGSVPYWDKTYSVIPQRR